jgi:endonuclease/exonuclease/phosphatase family metal-dependent hydrolase
MRLATFNLESLDLPPRAKVPLELRAEVLRPALDRLDADILCLQEVNAQRVPGSDQRSLRALDQLLVGTKYEHYARATTTAGKDRALVDVHNLVTLSRFPIRSHRVVLHDLVASPQYRLTTAVPAAADAQPIRFDRPVLLTEIELSGGSLLAVINVHLRAPLAASVPGQKLEPFVWRTVGGWAEGYLLSAVRRTTQALEIRLLLEALLDADKHRLIAVAGDFNAEDHEVPLRIILGAEEDTGNPALSARALVLLERSVPQDRRWSVLHHGRPQMLDHIAASHSLHRHFRAIEVHNEALSDELVGYARHLQSSRSYHAPVVAEFSDASL